LAEQASKYDVSQLKGLIRQTVKVPKIENNIIANRPDHTEPLP
jgi:hypothetical protein